MTRFRPRLRRLAPILRPRSRRALPRELRAENVGTLAARLERGLRDPGFATLLQRIDQAPIHGGNDVRIFHRGQEAFLEMRRAIEGATSEILLESYIFRDDATGWEIHELLRSAAARGVSVRVLADAVGSWSTRRTFWRELRSGGVEVRLFHPFLSHLPYQFYRDHRKILVADRRVGFTGGMNIGVEYGSPRRKRDARSWRDTHARVEGPAAWELAVVFSESWHRAGGSPIALPPLVIDRDGRPPGADVLILDSRPFRGHRESAAVLAAIAGAARESLLVTNAYFAPRWIAVEVLASAVHRGVDVRLLLPGSSDVPIVRHAGHGYFDALFERGVRVFEYQNSILHAKSLVADRFVTVVGSTNLDFRSFRFNAECNLVILDANLGEEMASTFEEDLKLSVEIRPESWSRRSVRHRCADALARRLSPLL